MVTRLSGLAVLGAAIAVIPQLGTEFLPEMNEGDIHITVTMPSETSLERGAQLLRDVRHSLLQFPEVRDVLTEQGHPATAPSTDDSLASVIGPIPGGHVACNRL